MTRCGATPTGSPNPTAFEYFIIGLILFNAVVLGLETLPSVMNGYSYWIGLSQQAILGVFIIEAALKIFALTPRADRYFRDGWNVFDFSIIVLSLVPATGGFAVIARLARLMRLLQAGVRRAGVAADSGDAGTLHP